ncbi:MAG TPA: hypothetical protein VKG90_02730 [Marmoricola sp.]|jgi:hypothetical protein|nr:hypothetical protein [Marmoricola sp.]
MDKLTLQELGGQSAELLPHREALGLWNFANVYATNSSLALNAATVNSLAISGASQTILVGQS